MAITVWAIGYDTTDAEKLAHFWSEVLRRPPGPRRRHTAPARARRQAAQRRPQGLGPLDHVRRSRGQRVHRGAPRPVRAGSPAFHGQHIEFDEALFSPRPASPLPIVVGGNGPPALRRAAAMGDGWHGLWRPPEQVRHARDVLATATRRPFTISVRTLAHPGATLTGPQAATALHGSNTDITTRAAEFAAAGVDELVIEPQSDSLDGFLDLITRLTELLVPVK